MIISPSFMQYVCDLPVEDMGLFVVFLFFTVIGLGALVSIAIEYLALAVREWRSARQERK